MYGLLYAEASSPLPGAALSMDGRLLLRQSAPLRQGSVNLAYDRPLLPSAGAGDADALGAAAATDLRALLAAYASRNLTTRFADDYRVWTAAATGGGGDSGDFELDVRVRVPAHELLLLRPSLGAMLKWGWVQFLAAFAAVWWVGSRLESAAFRLRVLETRVVSDVSARPSPKF